MLIVGRCHCGNIRFELTWAQDSAEIAVRACSCSFCQKHGGAWIGSPDASLVVRTEDPSRVSAYAFGTRTADFHVCSTCGVVPVVTSRIEERLYAVVSAHALEGVDSSLLRVAPVSFDGEATDVRLARRQRNWISRVDFHTRSPP